MTILTYGIIRDLEGGYFHPYMLVDGRIPSKGSSLYRTSGETYGGLDRHAGHDLFYRSQIPHGLRSSPIDAALYVQRSQISGLQMTPIFGDYLTPLPIGTSSPGILDFQIRSRAKWLF